jgi:hypothetical protein
MSVQDGFDSGHPVKDVLLQLEHAARRSFEELSFFWCHALIGANFSICSLARRTRPTCVSPPIPASPNSKSRPPEGNAELPEGFVSSQWSAFDADNLGTAIGDSNDRRMGDFCPTGDLRHPRMPGAWLDEGSDRSPCQAQSHQDRRSDPLPGVSQDKAAAAVENVLNSIGDTCPECPPNDD